MSTSPRQGSTSAAAEGILKPPVFASTSRIKHAKVMVRRLSTEKKPAQDRTPIKKIKLPKETMLYENADTIHVPSSSFWKFSFKPPTLEQLGVSITEDGTLDLTGGYCEVKVEIGTSTQQVVRTVEEISALVETLNGPRLCPWATSTLKELEIYLNVAVQSPQYRTSAAWKTMLGGRMAAVCQTPTPDDHPVEDKATPPPPPPLPVRIPTPEPEVWKDFDARSIPSNDDCLAEDRSLSGSVYAPSDLEDVMEEQSHRVEIYTKRDLRNLLWVKTPQRPVMDYTFNVTATGKGVEPEPEPNQPRPVLFPPRVRLDDFDILRVLGHGCSGKVLLCQLRATRTVHAVKVVHKTHVIAHCEHAHMKTEQTVLARGADGFGSPFLCSLQYSFTDDHNLFLVMELHNGGDIATRLALEGKLHPRVVSVYAAEILHGLHALHSFGVIYRDLKPENVLIGNDGHIILADFGLAKDFGPDMSLSPGSRPIARTFCGTAEYLAPEVLLGEPYSYECDYWAFGTMIYEMLAGTTPFWTEDQGEMYQRILLEPVDGVLAEAELDDGTCALLRELLHKDPTKRLCAPEIFTFRYFRAFDWVRLGKKGYPVPPSVGLCTSRRLHLYNFPPSFLGRDPNVSDGSLDYEYSRTDVEAAIELFDSFDFTRDIGTRDDIEDFLVNGPSAELAERPPTPMFPDRADSGVAMVDKEVHRPMSSISTVPSTRFSLEGTAAHGGADTLPPRPSAPIPEHAEEHDDSENTMAEDGSDDWHLVDSKDIYALIAQAHISRRERARQLISRIRHRNSNTERAMLARSKLRSSFFYKRAVQ